MKILIIKLGALGDVLLSTPIIREIQKHHQNDCITILTTPTYESFFKNFPDLPIKSFARKGLREFLKNIAWLRKQKFDRVYDLQSNDRTSIICALSNIPSRVGNHPRFPYNSHPEKKYKGECNSFDRLNLIIKSAGLKEALPKPFFPVSSSTIKKVKSCLNDKKLKPNEFVILHAGSSLAHKNKRWPHFLALAKKIIAISNLKTVWVGADEDKELNAKLALKCGLDMTNCFNIPELVELGRHACFAVTNDSAPMHILSHSNIPVFGIFGPTNHKRGHALGQADRVITFADKQVENDSLFKPEEISKITLDKVIKKIDREGLLKKHAYQ